MVTSCFCRSDTFYLSSRCHARIFCDGRADGLYTYQGSDTAYVPGNDGRPKNNVFEGNTVSNNDIGVKIKLGDGNAIIGEWIPSFVAEPCLLLSAEK